MQQALLETMTANITHHTLSPANFRALLTAEARKRCVALSAPSGLAVANR